MADILALQNICHRYNGRPVLQIPFFTIQAGEVVGLVGPNGSGKSTMLKLLAFVDKSTEGQVLFQGRPAEPFSSRVRSRVSLLLQDPYLLKRSVFDNIAYGLIIRGEKEYLTDRVAAALGQVGLPISFASRQWHELSGGEAQRVALAARLILKPDCLLLDEPTASVDVQSAEKIRQAILRARREWHTTIVIASHNRTWLDAICDRLVFLYNGRIYDAGIENIVLGPWEKLDDGRFGKMLSDNQMIAASNPPHPESCAMIQPSAISLARLSTVVPGDTLLTGRIASIFMENEFRSIMARVVCGDHSFTVDLGKVPTSEGKWFPGQEVALIIHPEDIQWLDT